MSSLYFTVKNVINLILEKPALQGDNSVTSDFVRQGYNLLADGGLMF